MAFRYDTNRVDAAAIQVTPQGAIRVTGQLTRSGVFIYEDSNGRKIREYRPPEEVERADSLASLEDAHVTIGHPPNGVSPDSYASRNVGHVRSSTVKVEKSDKRTDITASIFVARKDAIEALTSNPPRLFDTSAGYNVRIDETPGVTPSGESYDRVQRDIIYNHVALLPRGDGRLGTSLRLDGSGEQLTEEDPPMKLKIDGKEYEGEAACIAAITALEADRNGHKSRADGHAETIAKRDAADAKARRDSLESTASRVLGKDWKPSRKDGANEVALTDQEIMVAVITKADPSFKADGKDEAYIRVRFDMAASPAAAPGVRLPDPIVQALTSPGGGSADRVDAARATAQKTAESAGNAWRR